jgi:hypothetical protein
MTIVREEDNGNMSRRAIAIATFGQPSLEKCVSRQGFCSDAESCGTSMPHPAAECRRSVGLSVWSTEASSVQWTRSAQRGSPSVGSGEETDGQTVRLARSTARFRHAKAHRRAKAHQSAGEAEPRGRPIRSVVAGGALAEPS